MTLIMLCFQDLLGKISEPSHIHMVWHKLRKLYLSNNFIRELDDSLVSGGLFIAIYKFFFFLNVIAEMTAIG